MNRPPTAAGLPKSSPAARTRGVTDGRGLTRGNAEIGRWRTFDLDELRKYSLGQRLVRQYRLFTDVHGRPRRPPAVPAKGMVGPALRCSTSQVADFACTEDQVRPRAAGAARAWPAGGPDGPSSAGAAGNIRRPDGSASGGGARAPGSGAVPPTDDPGELRRNPAPGQGRSDGGVLHLDRGPEPASTGVRVDGRRDGEHRRSHGHR